MVASRAAAKDPMTWPWQTSTRVTEAQRLIQIEMKLDWLTQALLLIAPGLKDQLPTQLARTRPPLPANYRKRGADDVFQSSRYQTEEDRASPRTSPAPDPSLNASPAGASSGIPALQTGAQSPNVLTAPSPAKPSDAPPG